MDRPSTVVRRPSPSRRRRQVIAGVAVAISLGFLATACTSAEENSAISMVNTTRRAGFRADLSTNVSLTLTAQSWSAQLAKDGKLSHRASLSVGAPAGWKKLGENVGTGGSVTVIHNAFVASAPHLANIMDSAFNNLGIGVTVDGNGRRWEVQEFAGL
jgi:uncharacterized protein YkwD